MTAEVAVLNKGAVALAADSAVTIVNPNGKKVYNSVNKLFSLSRSAPIGVMIYGGAEICGVPWEVLIKEYRSELGDQRFDTLEEYCGSLREFVTASRFLTPQLQAYAVFDFARVMLRQFVVNEILSAVHRHFEENQTITRAKTVAIITATLADSIRFLEGLDYNPGFVATDVDRFVRRYRSQIDEALGPAIEDLPVGPKSMARIRRLFALLCCKQVPSPHQSGLVIAGYGESDLFPSVVSHRFDGYFLDKPRLSEGQVVTVGPSNSAAVMPFAQAEMVRLFMDGVDPSYRRTVAATIETFMTELPDIVVEAAGLTGSSKVRARTNLKLALEGVVEGYSESMRGYSGENHVMPVLEAVAALPKDELGAMAESLVNLTSFKRRVTLDTETVGGAIDVAVISKGDGFIWLKRKHYFEQEKNPQFVAKYYQ